jgi:aspartyl-tRNA(Asn)/glutamyl-tRNA(Gln) amidotransferase subunit A
LPRVTERLNAFTTVTAARARAEAGRGRRGHRGRPRSRPLAGVPYAVKNLFDLAGVVTIAGSKILREAPPAAADATAVARVAGCGRGLSRCRQHGRVRLRLRHGERACGADPQPARPRTLRRRIVGRIAAAVAAGLVPLSLGTDTNGSIRVPSSFCGIWG